MTQVCCVKTCRIFRILAEQELQIVSSSSENYKKVNISDDMSGSQVYTASIYPGAVFNQCYYSY